MELNRGSHQTREGGKELETADLLNNGCNILNGDVAAVAKEAVVSFLSPLVLKVARDLITDASGGREDLLMKSEEDVALLWLLGSASSMRTNLNRIN